MQNILAIVAHPDDEIIGVGGTLSKHQENGDNVHILILGDGKTSREENHLNTSPEILNNSIKETREALNILGIKNFYKENLPDNMFDSVPLLHIIKKISEYTKKITPHIVYTHHDGDINIDHKLTSEAVKTVCRPIETKSVLEIRLFETLSSTEMAGYTKNSVFLPNLFVDIDNHLAKKIAAMSCYKTEIRNFPHPRSLKTIEYNARMWGSKNNLNAAEAFYIFRSIK